MQQHSSGVHGNQGLGDAGHLLPQRNNNTQNSRLQSDSSFALGGPGAPGGEGAGHAPDLRVDVVPKTAENVHALCTGEEGFGYKGYNVSPRYPKIHVPGWGFTNHNGTAGKSIYGEKLPDGNFQLKHGGIGPNTNGSQFFICTASTEWLNGNHVVFGSVVDGLDVLKAIEEHGTKSGTPKAKVAIADCGELKYC
ncbi:peptidyl-prolyl cis-trans isomerase isoform X1 [Scophthalmus maximus]|nr:peptidyl-prolyl cis-trans isomerase isoform X1 [Scophthalmus maximus]